MRVTVKAGRGRVRSVRTRCVLSGDAVPLTAAVGLAGTALGVLRSWRVPEERAAPTRRQLQKLLEEGVSLESVLRERCGTSSNTLDAAGVEGGRRRRERERFAIEIKAVQGPSELMKALQLAMEVSSQEKFVTGRNQDAGPSGILGVVSRLPKIVADRLKYELSHGREVDIGPDTSTLRPPQELNWRNVISGDVGPFSLRWRKAVASTCGSSIPGYGITLWAKRRGETSGEPLGLATLRVKRLPPKELDAAKLAFSDDVLEADGISPQACFRNTAYLSWIGVNREYRGQAVGSQMISWMERKAAAWGLESLCLHCNVRNVKALEFYRNSGFEIVPDWMGWSRDEWFLLRKSLGRSSAATMSSEVTLAPQEGFVPQPIAISARDYSAGGGLGK